MSLDLSGIVRRLEWLEKWAKGVMSALADLRDQIGALRLSTANSAEPLDREGEIVIVRPAETIGMASFTEAVAAVPGVSPYVPAKIVPDTGLARIWQLYDPDTGELRALNTVRRWDPDAEPDPDYVDVDARVAVDNINPSEEIPSASRYVICVRKGGRLVAMVWECDPS